MANFSIDPVTSTDLKRLQLFAKRAFIDTYAAYNTPENMAGYLIENMSLSSFMWQWEQPESSFFQYLNPDLQGYVKLNWNSQITIKDAKYNDLEIEKIYVDHRLKKKGIGRALIEFSIQFAIQKEKQGLILGVWEKNGAAIGFYKKMGFQIIGEHHFQLGTDLQKDWVMRLNLDTLVINP